MVLVGKHDGTYRMCVVFQCTQKDAIPLPGTDDVLEALDGARWFSCMDLA